MNTSPKQPPRTRSRARPALRRSADVFAALGDQTRLSLLATLSGGAPLSITRLTEGHTLTRQAITRHLGTLERAGLVRSVRRGRENCFALETAPLEDARRALESISRQWDVALGRLKATLEQP